MECSVIVEGFNQRILTKKALLKNAYNFMYESPITNISMCKCKVFRKKPGNNLSPGEAR